MIKTEKTTDKALRVLVFGAADILIHTAIEKVKQQLPESTHITVVGNRKDIGLTNLVRMERRPGKMEELIRNDQFSGFDSENWSEDQWNRESTLGLDHLERKSESFVWRHHGINNIHDSQHYYCLVLDLLANYLEKERINLVLFFEIPHLFVDTLTYQIARSRKIDTLILSPTIFPGNFFSLRKIDDFGNLPSHTKFNVDQLAVDLMTDTDWKYMRAIKHYRGELGKLTFHNIFLLIVHLLATSPAKLVNFRFLFRTIRRMRTISSQVPKWRHPFSNYFDTRHIPYFETLLNYENRTVDFDRKFVYFPLHLQPEMTTSAIGKDYSDQLSAIERLAHMLPDNWSIYVKENPKQGGQMRGQQFFKRLLQLESVCFIPSYINTHELIEKSQFIAVITGTAGWEAICKGKNVLVFGQPWYQSLPGVFRFDEALSYEQIVNYRIDQEQLESQVSALFARAHKGEILPLKRRITKGSSNVDANAELVAKSIVGLIEGKIESTFSS